MFIEYHDPPPTSLTLAQGVEAGKAPNATKCTVKVVNGVVICVVLPEALPEAGASSGKMHAS